MLGSRRDGKAVIDESLKKAVLWANAVLVPLAAFIAWRLGAVPALVASVVGSGVGLANLAAMAWLMGRLVAGGDRGRSVYGGLLALKLGAVLAVIAVLIWALKLNIVGFVVGFSAVMAGLIGGSFVASLGRASGTQEKQEIG